MNEPDAPHYTPSPWWGSFTLERGQVGHWEIGPLNLDVLRFPREWRLIHWSDEDHLSEDLIVDCPLALSAEERIQGELPKGAKVTRFATARAETRLTIEPALADRPVVTRPEIPIFAMAGDEVELYVGTPLWVRLLVGDDQRLLSDIPAFRPSDTWFGPSTQQGELAYAARTNARLGLDELRPKPSRALTRVTVRNVGPDNIKIERLNLPVPRLTLYVAASGLIWTSSVTVERHKDDGLARIITSDAPPDEAGLVEQLAGPRLPEERNAVFRALSALLN